MAWLIAYDIANPRRLQRVHKRVVAECWRLQYSLYWTPLDHRGIRALAADLERLIDPKADDVRFYLFPDDAWCRLYGPKPWAEGVIDAFTARFAPCWRPHSPVEGLD